MDWTFYLIVGCSLAIAFLIIIIGKYEKKEDEG
jgi:predicted outer membrane lipoprotein